MASHFEGYAFAIYKQEINTKDLQYRRYIKFGITQPRIIIVLRMSHVLEVVAVKCHAATTYH